MSADWLKLFPTWKKYYKIMERNWDAFSEVWNT